MELARAGPLAFTAGAGGKVTSWDLASGETRSLRAFSEANFVTALRAAPDDRLYAATSEGELALLAGDLSSRAEVRAGLRSGVRALAVTHDPGKLVAATESNQLHVLDVEGEKLLSQRFLEGHSDLITDVLAFPDAPVFLSAALDKTVKQWDLRSGYVGNFAVTDDRCIWALEFLQHSQQVVLGADSGELLFYAR